MVMVKIFNFKTKSLKVKNNARFLFLIVFIFLHILKVTSDIKYKITLELFRCLVNISQVQISHFENGKS